MFKISHERIYQFILRDKQQGGGLYTHLRHQHKKYRKRYGSPKRQGSIKNRVMIDERSAIVDEKTRLGDWEIERGLRYYYYQLMLLWMPRHFMFIVSGTL